MKKILQITTIDMTTYCFHLPFLEFLHKQGFQVYAAFTEGKFTPLIQEKGVKTFNIPIERGINPVKDFISFIRLYKLIKKEKFDIVHTATSKAGFIGRAAARLCRPHFAKTPIIIHTSHELPQNSTRNPFLKFFYRCLEKLASRWTDKLITVSKPNVDQMLKEKIASREKIYLVPNGIDIEKFDIRVDKIKKKEALGIDKDSILIGMVGRLEKVKGHKYLIEAAFRVVKDYPQAVFYIIGEGQLKDSIIKEINAKCLQKNVILSGFCENLPETLNALDIFVSASLWEGFGVAVAEAFACGLPVVTTGVGGVTDFAVDGKTALVVPARDSDALYKAITFMIENPNKASFCADNAKEKIKTDFSQQQMIDKLWKIYKELLQFDKVTKMEHVPKK